MRVVSRILMKDYVPMILPDKILTVTGTKKCTFVCQACKTEGFHYRVISLDTPGVTLFICSDVVIPLED